MPPRRVQPAAAAAAASSPFIPHHDPRLDEKQSPIRKSRCVWWQCDDETCFIDLSSEECAEHQNAFRILAAVCYGM